MNDTKRRLARLERAANADEVRVVVYWGHEERPRPKLRDEVIVLTWADNRAAPAHGGKTD